MTELATSLFIVLAVSWVLWEAREWSLRARLFPWTIGFPLLVLACVQLVLTVRRSLAPPGARLSEIPAAVGPAAQDPDAPALALDPSPDQALAIQLDEPATRARALGILCWIVGFGAGLAVLGFRVGSPLLVIFFLRFGSGESWRTTLTLAVVTYGLFLVIFEFVLHVPLGGGLLAETLGLRSLDAFLVDAIGRLRS